jgi:hypothetical protein
MGDGPLGRDLFSDGYLRREQLHLPASMSPALKAVGRFWWLALIGAAVGVVAAAALVSRQPPAIYTASDTVLVSSPNAPYLRTAQTQTTQTAGKGKPVKGKPVKPSSSTTIVPPDTQVLVNAANLYPQFIQSDEIRKLRVKLYGATPGTVTATALASSTNTYGVYHPSPLPLITVKTTSRQPQAAARLATNTVRAFGIWLLRRQQQSGIPKSQRITIEQLRVRVLSSSSSKLGLPLFAGVLVLLAFCGLAVLVDRMRPRREGALDDAAPVAHRRVA